jgi:hypothetical protein
VPGRVRELPAGYCNLSRAVAAQDYEVAGNGTYTKVTLTDDVTDRAVTEIVFVSAFVELTLNVVMPFASVAAGVEMLLLDPVTAGATGEPATGWPFVPRSLTVIVTASTPSAFTPASRSAVTVKVGGFGVGDEATELHAGKTIEARAGTVTAAHLRRESNSRRESSGRAEGHGVVAKA